MSQEKPFPYLHGFNEEEQNRLVEQAKFIEPILYKDVDFYDQSEILEVGSGVGAQTEILLRRFPDLKVFGIELNEKQLSTAQKRLSQLKHLEGRWQIVKMNAENMNFKNNRFDGAFISWLLEHVPDPRKVLSELRRVLRPGAVVYINEVLNSSWFLEPYSPHIWKYWQAFNDYQYDNAGDPFIGAKLGNLLFSLGYNDIQTEVKSVILDNRTPEKRMRSIEYWGDLMLSAEQALLSSQYIDKDLVDEMKKELQSVKTDPNAAFVYSYMAAKAKVNN